MFISTLIIIPWIIFGFKHPQEKFIGLNQTKKSLLSLAVVELGYFLILILTLGSESKYCAGCGSFAWNYFLVYEKGIVPIFGIAELITPTGGDMIDREFPFLYLVTALIMDYILLFIISPRITQFFKTK